MSINIVSMITLMQENDRTLIEELRSLTEEKDLITRILKKRGYDESDFKRLGLEWMENKND